MTGSELERAFGNLAEALTIAETELNEEIVIIQQQIGQLKERIQELVSKQETLNHDREAIAEMYERYCGTDSSGLG